MQETKELVDFEIEEKINTQILKLLKEFLDIENKCPALDYKEIDETLGNH